MPASVNKGVAVRTLPFIMRMLSGCETEASHLDRGRTGPQSRIYPLALNRSLSAPDLDSPIVDILLYLLDLFLCDRSTHSFSVYVFLSLSHMHAQSHIFAPEPFEIML